MGDEDARWEYPIGGIDPGETPLEAAIREWQEETGAKFPKGAENVGTWLSEDGELQGFVFRIAREESIEFGAPDGHEISAVSWWDVDELDDEKVRGKIRDTLDRVEPILEQAQKDARGYELSPRSGMVSLDIAPGVLPVVPGGIDDHHITIVYLGKDVDDALFAEVCAVVRAIASTTPGPLTGTLGGLGTFPASNSSDGMVPVFVTPEIPGIEALRAPLERFNASEHKDFHPHATLAYLDEGDPMPEPVENVPVRFNHISVHRGDEIVRFPFRGCEAQHRFAENVMEALRR
jgi:ADP-ribose pyrophosphatase YjhB (NUDIX family)